MKAPRVEKLAQTLVNYSIGVQPGDTVALSGDISGLPWVREVYKQVILAGGLCATSIGDQEMGYFLLNHGNDDQLAWLSPMAHWSAAEADILMAIRSSNNTRAGSNIDSKRVAAQAAAHSDLGKLRFERAATGKQRWVIAMFPTDGNAQEADMSLEAWEDFVYKACFVDQPDPVQCWRDVEKNQQKYVDWLKGRDQVTVRGPNVDLSLSIKARTFINSTAKHNMPSGEIFTGPVEESVNGWVRFTYPVIRDGRQIDGVPLKFEKGKVISATATKNEAYLLSMLDTDPGARYLGEWAVGTNFGINRFTGLILFDEKIGGTMHMAVGRGYPETGSHNESAIHWDMICDMRDGSEIVVDGELLYKNGQFVF